MTAYKSFKLQRTDENAAIVSKLAVISYHDSFGGDFILVAWHIS